MLVSGRFRSIQAAAALASILIGGIASTLAEEVVPFSCKAKSVTSLSAELDSPSAQPAFPIPKGQIAKAIQGLDGIVGEALNRSGVPGLAIAVVHDDEVVYAKGFGVRRVGSGEPVDQNTVFQLASVSKPLGSTVIAGVIGQGSGLDWNTPVAKHLTGFALADPYVSSQVTIGDLYSHRSGLPDHAGDLLEDLGYEGAALQ
jgi:CubicO group peptidase (beta-lactamase class C family)